MKVDLFAMPTIYAESWKERERLRPIGRNSERYQKMLEELRDLAQMADELGVDAFSTTEHHFHTEGNEALRTPMMLFADFASRTKNIHCIPMSIVMTTHDPIRVAEDIAMLDQLTKGRVGVAFARGYQKRWMQVIGQGGTVATGDQSAADLANRERYDEGLAIVREAWEKDCFDYDGKHFQVPFPHDTGIEGWAAVEYTRTFGADGEIDDDGVIRKIGVCPRPYQEPHPPIFDSRHRPNATLDQGCARERLHAVDLGVRPGEVPRRWYETYQAHRGRARSRPQARREWSGARDLHRRHLRRGLPATPPTRPATPTTTTSATSASPKCSGPRRTIPTSSR